MPPPGEITELSLAHNEEMLALVKLTQPGPFGTRTRELGEYIGVVQNGRLVSMAGERLKFAGYTEVSAVCTHPDFTGKGLSAMLCTEMVRRIRARGDQPMLHVRNSNTRAIALYERLGFRKRRTFNMAVYKAAKPAE